MGQDGKSDSKGKDGIGKRIREGLSFLQGGIRGQGYGLVGFSS